MISLERQIEQMKEKLKALNSQGYIERCKEEMDLRKTLFLIEIKDLKLTILADTSLHGRDNVVKHMKRVNPESPLPENIQFSTLWLRMSLGEFQSLQVLYPTLLH